MDYTVVGGATGTSQIVGRSIINTSTESSILTVRNPSGSTTALTITPLAGGTRPVFGTFEDNINRTKSCLKQG